MKAAEYLPPPPPEEGEKERTLERLLEVQQEQVRARGQRRWLIPAALACAAAAALFLTFSLRQSNDPSTWVGESYMTSTTAVTKQLPDGSRLSLQPQTRVALEEARSTRVQLQVHEGSARFEVTKKPERKFVVQAPGLRIEVRGTVFTVDVDGRGADAQTHVEVTEGRVALFPDGQGREILLTAGQSWSRAPATAKADVAQDDEERDARGVDEARSPKTETKVASKAPRPPTDKQLLAQGNAARARGDRGAAISAYSELLRLHPESQLASLASLELGRLRLKEGQSEAAVKDLEASLETGASGSQREDSLANLVTAYEKAGDLKQCRSAQKRYLREFAGGVRSAEIRGRCGSAK